MLVKRKEVATLLVAYIIKLFLLLNRTWKIDMNVVNEKFIFENILVFKACFYQTWLSCFHFLLLVRKSRDAFSTEFSNSNMYTVIKTVKEKSKLANRRISFLNIVISIYRRGLKVKNWSAEYLIRNCCNKKMKSCFENLNFSEY